jgi:hypothetical protein
MSGTDQASPQMPDDFDRLLGSLHGLPDVTLTKPSTMRTMTPLLGTSQMFIVQTYRQRDRGDTIFLECVSKDGSTRIALPAAVADAIARQRESLNTKSRRRGGQAAAALRKERGDPPPFQRKKKS